MPDPCAASTFSQIFAGNFLLCRQKPDLAAAEQAQIQSVADNAGIYYGFDSVVSQVAQASADVQQAYATSDTTQITNDNASTCTGIDLSYIGIGCVENWKIYIAVGIVLLILLGPYIFPFVAPKRR
jgi:hypothetical protein